MKKITIFGSTILLLSLLLVGCGGNKQNSSNNSTGDSGTTNTTSESDNTNYGKVSFKPIYVYADNVGNNFDEVPIRPFFTNPEVCQNEVFEYEIKDEEIIVEVNHVMEDDHYIEWISSVSDNDEQIKYLKPGMKAKARFKYHEGMILYAYCNKHSLWKKEVE